MNMPDHSMRQLAAVAARNNVLTTILESPEGLTINEVATIHGITYHTARNYLKSLVEDHKIDLNGKSRERQMVYCGIDYSRMPKYKSTPIWTFLQNMHNANPPVPLPISEAGRQYLFLTASLFDRARMSASAGRGDPPLQRKDLRDIRTGFLELREQAVAFVEALDRVIENPDLWESGATLERVLLEDPETPVRISDITDLHYKAKIRLNETKGQL